MRCELLHLGIANGGDLADTAIRALEGGALSSYNGNPSKSTLIIHSVQRVSNNILLNRCYWLVCNNRKTCWASELSPVSSANLVHYLVHTCRYERKKETLFTLSACLLHAHKQTNTPSHTRTHTQLNKMNLKFQSRIQLTLQTLTHSKSLVSPVSFHLCKYYKKPILKHKMFDHKLLCLNNKCWWWW